MKKAFIVLFCTSSLMGSAQRDAKPVQISHYVIDTFVKGQVLVKSGVKSNQVLNYNILTNEVIYMDGGKYLAIGNPQDVDTVYMGDRKFVPVEKKFYEVLTNKAVPLFIEYSAKIDDPSVSVGYGSASATTNTTTYSSLVTSGAVYDINLPSDFKVEPLQQYWIRQNGRYQKINNVQQLAKAFPTKKDELKDFAKKNNTNFSKKEDVIKLVELL